MSRQLQFSDQLFNRPSDEFGGDLLRGNNPNTQRPLESKLPLHLVLKGVCGGMRSPLAIQKIDRLVVRTAKKYDVRIYKFANVGNHLHMLVKIGRRSGWLGFIRELTGKIGTLMKMLRPELKAKYWAHRPYTRIVRGWKKAFAVVKDYVTLNHLEAEGVINRNESKVLLRYRKLFKSTA